MLRKSLKRYLQKREDHIANVLADNFVVAIQLDGDSADTTQLGEVRFADVITVFDTRRNARWLAGIIIFAERRECHEDGGENIGRGGSAAFLLRNTRGRSLE